MTGTASTFTEDTTPAEQQQRFVNRISDWVFGHNGKIYSDCRLIDISECGGALLIPKNSIIPHNIFDLIIHDPDNTNKTSMITHAELRWSDIDYSESNIKIGFKFSSNSPSKKRAIKHLINYAKNNETMYFECSLIF